MDFRTLPPDFQAENGGCIRRDKIKSGASRF